MLLSRPPRPSGPPARALCLAAFLAGASVAAAPAAWAQTPGFDIIGADPALDANIRAHVRLPDLACNSSALRLSRFLAGIRRDIVRASRALGYYRLEQDTRFETGEEQSGDCWRLVTELETGEPVLFGEVNIDFGEADSPFGSSLGDLPIETGAQLNQSLYEQVKTQLSSAATELGYFDARYERTELRLDLINNRADVDIAFDPGQRYRVGAITFQELDALAPEFIQRFIEIDRGDFYSSDALLSLRDAFNGSQYFNQVSVTPLVSEAVDGEVPIRINLATRPQQAYSVGAGATTDIGPRLRADYEDRYFNRRGHSYTAGLGLSPIQQNLDLVYRVPARRPATEYFELNGGFLVEDTDTYRNEQTRLGAHYSHITSSDWRQVQFIHLQHDDSVIGSENVQTDLLILGTRMTRTVADDALYPRRGWTLFGEILGASDRLLSSDSFLQLNVSGKWIGSLPSGRLLARFDVGTSLLDDVSRLPASLRYFSGGDQSVRGYRYESLGPLDEEGEVVGGSHRLTTSLEYDFSIAESWKLALFVDVGNAFNDFDDLELKTGAGIGVRWLSPVGPIRIDLASALDNDNELRLHITMGPDL